jgi:ParB-like chromosome segregation protein Spo0J
MARQWDPDSEFGKPGYGDSEWSYFPEKILSVPEELGRFKKPSEEKFEQMIVSLIGGQLQPITVRPLTSKNDQFKVVFGFTRHNAFLTINQRIDDPAWADWCVKHGLTPGGEKRQIKFVIKKMNDKEARLANIRENLVTTRPTAMDHAWNMKMLQDKDNYTEDMLAAEYGESSDWVRKTLNLLLLSDDMRNKIHDGLLKVDAAMILASIPEGVAGTTTSRDAVLAEVEDEVAKTGKKVTATKISKVAREKGVLKGVTLSATERRQAWISIREDKTIDPQVVKIAEVVTSFGKGKFTDPEALKAALAAILRGVDTQVPLPYDEPEVEADSDYELAEPDTKVRSMTIGFDGRGTFAESLNEYAEAGN